MSKKILATAEEIRAEIARRIAAEPTGQCRDCVAPMPVPIERRDGVNWSVDHFPKLVPGCTAIIMRILSSMMDAYDLADANGKAQ
ncbi:MAG: hypothetical protein JNL04_07510 [Rhodospirillaceae bacterium]|nr:hypothetical protein [Rhodospirillaceae bacterium]